MCALRRIELAAGSGSADVNGESKQTKLNEWKLGGVKTKPEAEGHVS